MKRSMQLLISLLALLFAIGWQMQTPAYAQETGCAETVSVQPGDTLSLLAGRHLGNTAAFDALVEATNNAAGVDSRYTPITNPALIGVGWQICIPATDAPAPSPSAGPPTAAPTPVATVPAVLQEYSDPTEHPLAVEALREREYPGSDITIESTLAPGTNYQRYLVSYRSEGFKIFALMTVPTGEAPESGWPVILFNHGHIPPTIYRTGTRYVNYVDALARNGYIVLMPDYRGHGASEGEPASGHGSPDYTIDVLNALSSVQRFPAADPERIGMWGHSMGGGITLRSMVVNDDIKAGVIWAGVVVSFSDLFTREELQGIPVPEWLSEWRDNFLDQYGTLAENPAFWRAISPNAYLADLSGPLQLHHGTADTSVPVQYSDVLRDQIEEVEGMVEAYRYPGDEHNISQSFTTAMDRSIAFFDRYVKGSGASDQ